MGEMGLMGTNYYVVPNRPSIESYHLGKSSAGWKFCFQTQDMPWCDPPIVWRSYAEVEAWLKKYVGETKEFVIMDEYDAIVNLDYFFNLVAKKQQENNPEDFRYNENVDGYRFCEGDFC